MIRRARVRQGGAAAVAALLLLLAGACATTQRSTRMTNDDLVEMSRAMAQSLTLSPWLAERGPDSTPIVVSIDKVRNLSSDVMTESEQWFVIQRLRSSLPITALWDQKKVRFVIPPQRREAMQRRDDLGPDADNFGTQRQPTHQMTATFRSITRADATHRTDLYYCEFEILDITAGTPVWIDKFEFKRDARGHVLD